MLHQTFPTLRSDKYLPICCFSSYFMAVWSGFYTDCSKPHGFHVEVVFCICLSNGPKAGVGSEMVAREIQELTCLPLLPFRSSQPGRHLSTGPQGFCYWMEEMNREREIAVPRLHAEKGAPHVAMFPIWDGEVEDGESQMQEELVSSSSLSTWKIKRLDSKPEINHHSTCKMRS